MKRILTPLHVVAASVGVLCTAVEVASNVEHQVHHSGTIYDPAVAAVVATSIGVTITLACAIQAFRQWQFINGVALLLAFALGAGFTLSTTLDRVASARDAALSKKWEYDQQHKELVTLFQRVSYMAARECGSGRGQKCDAISSEVRIAEQRITQRRGELDSMGKRLAAIIPGMDAASASLFQPMLLPVSLFLMGSFLVAFGIGGQKREPEFNTELTGRAATEAKARRFSEQFKAEHGRAPRACELASALGLTSTAARRLLKR